MAAGERTLAVLGGAPSFPLPLHVNAPAEVGRDRFLALVAAAFERRWFTNDGPLVRELETRLADFLRVPHCVLTCNGTQGLELLLSVLGLKGEVIVPAFGFVALPHAVLRMGLTPVFCDIDASSWCLDPVRCEELITPNTAAIVGLHLWGQPCAPDQLSRIASRRGLTLLFDAAHGFGSMHRGVPLGGLGDAEFFSFHATKIFHTFEGGAVTTHDGELADELRRARNFGFSGQDEVVRLGTNAKMSEPCAAMGLANLDSFGELRRRSRAAWDAYGDVLRGVRGLRLMGGGEARHCPNQYVVLAVDAAEFGLTRDELQEALRREGVLARRYFYPGCHRMEPYRSMAAGAIPPLPVTDAVAGTVLVLPGGAGIDSREAGRAGALVAALQGLAPAVRRALSSS